MIDLVVVVVMIVVVIGVSSISASPEVRYPDAEVLRTGSVQILCEKIKEKKKKKRKRKRKKRILNQKEIEKYQKTKSEIAHSSRFDLLFFFGMTRRCYDGLRIYVSD